MRKRSGWTDAIYPNSYKQPVWSGFRVFLLLVSLSLAYCFPSKRAFVLLPFCVTLLQKMQDECQDRRSCQVLVNSRVFGTDQCPGSSKYLIVWYKCRPSKSLVAPRCDSDKNFCPSLCLNHSFFVSPPHNANTQYTRVVSGQNQTSTLTIKGNPKSTFKIVYQGSPL